MDVLAFIICWILSIKPYQKTVIIINTIISLTGSCLGTFATTSIVRQKFSMQDILNVTLAGGVIIGAPCGIFTNPAAPLCIGLFAGVISTLGFRYQNLIGLHDSRGIHNLHGMPGILGGVFSAIAIASYGSAPLTDTNQISYLSFYPQLNSNVNLYGRTFYQQGGYQIAAIFISMGIGIIFGIAAGYMMKIIYAFSPSQIFNDQFSFEGVPQKQIVDQKLDFIDNPEMKNSHVEEQISQQKLAITPDITKN